MDIGGSGGSFTTSADHFLRMNFLLMWGPYMPFSMWLLKFSSLNFKKFILLNDITDGLFAFFSLLF